MHQRRLGPKISIWKRLVSLGIFQLAVTEDCQLSRPSVSIRLMWILLWTFVYFTFSATVRRETAVKTYGWRAIRSFVSYTGCFTNTYKYWGVFFSEVNPSHTCYLIMSGHGTVAVLSYRIISTWSSSQIYSQFIAQLFFLFLHFVSVNFSHIQGGTSVEAMYSRLYRAFHNVLIEYKYL
jgi:hypothetical protein